MKKLIAMIMCIAACGTIFAGCSRNNDNSSGNDNAATTKTTTTKASSVTSEKHRDDSDTLISRVEDGVKDTVSGGAEIIGDTVSTAEDVVDDILR